jgi:hypothetical protein
MRYCVAVAAVVLSIYLAQGAFSAPPKPSVVPLSWDLDFKFQDLRSITVTLPGETQPKKFWYLLYTIVNNTKADQVFVPEMVLYTDNGQVLDAGNKVPTPVFTAIQKRANNPLLMESVAITGKILQGEDNAKDGVAIWRDIDPEARSFDIFIGGLSGERVKVEAPTAVGAEKPEGENPPTASAPTTQGSAVFLSKTLQLHYTLPGDPTKRDSNPPKLESKDWVMR